MALLIKCQAGTQKTSVGKQTRVPTLTQGSMQIKIIILHISEAHEICHYPISLSLVCFLLIEAHALERTQETVEWRDSESAHCRDPCIACCIAHSSQDVEQARRSISG